MQDAGNHVLSIGLRIPFSSPYNRSLASTQIGVSTALIMRPSSLASFLYLFGFASAASCPYAGALRTKRAAPPDANHVVLRSDPAAGKKGVFFHNRISPGTSQLYIANANGSDARLLLGNNTVYEYDAQWSPDAEWIVFTSERNGDGNSVKKSS